MTPISIWTAGLASPLGYGGWAWLAVQGDVVKGHTGGERNTSELRMGLTGLLKALQAAADQPGAALRLHMRLAAPESDRDLWEEIVAARAARKGPVTLVSAPTPAADAFVREWAALAQDKVKAGGAFAFPIPKHTLQAILAKTRGQP
jgi:ribonuclease HI